jgi:acyl dehydratase
MALNSREEIKAKIGREIGVSDWVLISQDMIDRFADVTGDHQFIHVDPKAAAMTPFGGTIAHGFLVLSMLAKLGLAADFAMEGVTMGVNYGFEKVRLVAPVRAGKRIRGRFVLKNMVERAPGQWMATLGVTVEIEGEAKPAIVADWQTLQFVQ